MAEKVRCPVCGKYEFGDYADYDICDICDWCNDALQNKEPDYRGGANKMSLNEARQAYKEGRQIR